MTRKMADSVTASNLPAGFDLYAGYVDGAYKNYAAIEAMYPGKVVGIAVFSTTDDGIVGDCETGDMSPVTAVNWVLLRRKAGVDPTIYCSEALWPTVRAAFQAIKVPEPHYWIAGYPGSVGEALYPGAVAHQWIDRGPYDESVVADYWPGVDPLPPLPVDIKEETMSIVALPNPQHPNRVAISAVGAGSRADHMLVFTINDPTNPSAPGYNVLDVTDGIGTADPYTVSSA